ncbi:hypothetical protein [Sphingomonas adhaesiva]|uniref:hypothetical protein n=1 Tax=Sphingomonas adhaesiva TaxID=28212 RepID=UPI002FF47816
MRASSARSVATPAAPSPVSASAIAFARRATGASPAACAAVSAPWSSPCASAAAARHGASASRVTPALAA